MGEISPSKDVEEVTSAFLLGITAIVNKFREEIRTLLRDLTNGELDGPFIEEIAHECRLLLVSLPESSEGLCEWVKQFAQTVCKVRCKNDPNSRSD